MTPKQKAWRKWKAKQPDQRRAEKRAWYAKNKERIREQQRAASRKSYYANHATRRAAARARTKRLWQEQPAEMRRRSREASRRWRKLNRERANAHARRSVLKRQFGLTIAQYDALLAKQKGLCAICTKPDTRTRLAVDHDHQTGRIRGLLCRACNVALGKFGDDPVMLQRALNYLLNVEPLAVKIA